MARSDRLPVLIIGFPEASPASGWRATSRVSRRTSFGSSLLAFLSSLWATTVSLPFYGRERSRDHERRRWRPRRISVHARHLSRNVPWPALDHAAVRWLWYR